MAAQSELMPVPADSVDIASLGAAAFAAMLGQPAALQIVAGPFAGRTLAGAVLLSAVERPRAARPGHPRMPFILNFKVPDPDGFHGGDCVLEMPGQGVLGPVYCERTMAPASDPAGAYFAIQFV